MIQQSTFLNGNELLHTHTHFNLVVLLKKQYFLLSYVLLSKAPGEVCGTLKTFLYLDAILLFNPEALFSPTAQLLILDHPFR